MNKLTRAAKQKKLLAIFGCLIALNVVVSGLSIGVTIWIIANA